MSIGTKHEVRPAGPPRRPPARRASGGRRALAVGLTAALACVVSSACAPEPAEWMATDVPEPVVFAPGTISTDQWELGVTFSPDGREAYLTRRERRGPTRILVFRWSQDGWSGPEPAPFAADGDEAPFVSADGRTLVFASRRPVPGTRDRSENLWITRRTADGWSAPEPLPGTVNQPRSEIDDFDTGTETGPVLLADGVLLYTTRVSPDWGTDIYMAEPDGEGGWHLPRALRLSTTREESNPALSPDGRWLVFQSYRDIDGPGGDDLYVAERTEYGWSEPRLLPEPINSEGFDGHPTFSPDGRSLLFASDRGSAQGDEDIWIVSVAALGLEP